METIPSYTSLNSQRKPMDREQDRKQIEADIETFLARGGKITVLDAKASGAWSNRMGEDSPLLPRC